MKNKVVSALILGLYAIVSVATSVKKDELYETRHFSVSTNCGNATMTSGQIAVTQGLITSPSRTSFIAVGIPSETLNIGNNVSGELAPALTRTCNHSLDKSTPNVTVSVYTCDDNGVFSCVVNFTYLD